MMNILEAYNKFDFFVVAHRGASGVAPENTLASFQIAIQSGAHFIETDIQVTSDGVPIVFHDKGLSRTTNGSGFANRLTYNELKKFDSGFWFGKEYEGERIPSLEELLQFADGKILLNIELKNLGTSPEHSIKSIFNLVQKYDFVDKVVFSSFYYNQLKISKEIYPNIPIAPIKIPKDNTKPSDLKKILNCEGFVCGIDEISEKIVQDAHQSGLFVGVYSIDTEEHLQQVINLGVKAIVTNFPKEIINLLKNKYNAKV